MKNTVINVLQKAGDFINSSDAHRAAFICWMAIPIYILLFIWCVVTLCLKHYFPGIVDAPLSPLLVWSGVLALIYLPLGSCYRYAVERPCRAQRYVFAVLHFYTITTMVTCFMLGPLNIMTGLVLMGSPMLGVMLFHPKQLTLAFTSCTVLVLLASFLLVNDAFPLKPVFHDHSSDYMIICNIVGALFYTAYEVALMASLIRAWKSRESGVKHLSITDTLTGVANRRYILELLELEFAQRRHGDQHFGLIMADIDHFKRINDTYGHQTGDRVLQSVANTLRACLRQQDKIGRYGGEEFLILMPFTPPEQARQIAERCRQAIAELVLPDNLPLSLTISLGVTSQIKNQVSNADDLIHQADIAMYEAKNLGRNRVVLNNASG
jgi:diguanylate cyclase (GGDEF)-like protein